MNDFININTTAFTEAVSEATSTLQGDVSTLFDKVRALETAANIDATQFDGDLDSLRDFVTSILDDKDYVTSDDVETIVADTDLSDAIDHAMSDYDFNTVVEDTITDSMIRDSIGISRYEEIITDDNFSSYLDDHLDLSNCVKDDEIDTCISAWYDANVLKANDNLSPYAKDLLLDLLSLTTDLIQQVANLRTMCGLANADLLTQIPDLRKKIINY